MLQRKDGHDPERASKRQPRYGLGNSVPWLKGCHDPQEVPPSTKAGNEMTTLKRVGIEALT